MESRMSSLDSRDSQRALTEAILDGEDRTLVVWGLAVGSPAGDRAFREPVPEQNTGTVFSGTHTAIK